MDNCHGHFAFAQVAGHGLAEHVFGGGEVEHVINNLEGHSQVAAIFAEAVLFLFRSSGDDGAHAHADRKQASGLAVDKVKVLVERDALAQLLDLQQLALDHLLGKINEHVEDAEVALLHRDAEGLHVEPVAGQHAHGVPPVGVGGGTSAASLGLVNDVVMDQGSGVNDLHHRAQLDDAASAVIEELCREQQQRGTNALAAASAQIFADIGDGADIRNRIAAEL